jgi:hypothetical protein
VRRLQRLGHSLAGLGTGGLHPGFMRPACQVGGAARIVLGLLYPRRLQKTYHAAGGGCRNRACQVRSWSSEEAGWTWTQVAEIGPFAHATTFEPGLAAGRCACAAPDPLRCSGF